MKRIIAALKMNDECKNIILNRYVAAIIREERSMRIICFFYILFSYYVTIGGILISSLLLLEKATLINATTANAISWLTWVLSLLISVANKSIDRFGLDKKYILDSRDLELLKSEGWQFIELTGRYRDFLTHDDAFKHFSYRIEQLRIKHTLRALEIIEDKVPHYKFSSYAGSISSLQQRKVVTDIAPDSTGSTGGGSDTTEAEGKKDPETPDPRGDPGSGGLTIEVSK